MTGNGSATAAARRLRRLRGATCLLAALGLAWPAAASRPIRFDRISIDQGLSQATVTCMLQDRVGFLWIGTQDGLNRYDGAGFVVLKNEPDDPASLSNNWIRALLEDAGGDIWIGTRGGGLNLWRRDSGTFERYLHDPGDPTSLSGNLVRALLVDRQGRLWVGTEQSGLNRLDPVSGSFERFVHDPGDPASLASNEIRALYEDRDGRLWVGTLGGLDLLDEASGGFRHLRHDPSDPASLNDDRVRSILEDREGNLWVGTFGGLARLDRESWRVARFAHDPADPRSLSENRVRVLFEDQQDRLWVGTDLGLNLHDAAGDGFAHYRFDPADATSLSNDRVTSIFQDRGGVLWVGTQGGGVNKWVPRTWSFYNDPVRLGALSSRDILALSADARGGLWLGTAGGGLNRVDRATGEVRVFRPDPGRPDSLSDERVTALLHDSRGVLWVGTLAGGLNRLRPDGTFDHYRHDPARPGSLGGDGVMSLYEDRGGELWVGTLGGGLDRLDRARGTFESWRSDPDDPTSLSNDRVTAFAEDAEGYLWVGTLSAGINRFDRERGTFVRVRHDPARADSLSSDTIMTIYTDPGGTLWVGTQVGLNRLVGLDETSGQASFRRYLERDGLASDFIYGIRADRSGRLWLSTNHGLSRLDPETGEVKNYDTSHGLQSNEFNMNAYFQGSDGELFFGGIGGYNAFFPERIEENRVPPPVVLTDLAVLNRPVALDRPVFDLEEITLEHTDNVVSFEFAALDYTAAEKNRYRYQLEGFDHDWIDLGTRRLVTFTNLDPGSYTLRVQGSNNDGVWNQEGLAVAVIIPPPFWQTWWFRGLLVLAGAALVFLVVTLRTRSVRRQNELLERLVAERTGELEQAQDQLLRRERLAVLGELAGSVAHELRNPLGAIKNSAYFLRLTGSLAEGKQREHLGLIEREIERSNTIITELLDYGRSPKPRFRRAVLQEIVSAALAKTLVPEGITVERAGEGAPLTVEVDPEQIERALMNLIQNAVQAMRDSGRLRIGCSLRDGQAVVSVADDGPGIDPENLERIFEPLFTGKAKGIGLGLPVSQRYANLNRGEIEVESSPGEGATFHLVLPLAAAEPQAEDLERATG